MTGLDPAAPRRFDDFHNRLNAGIPGRAQPAGRAPASANAGRSGSGPAAPTTPAAPTLSQLDVTLAREAAAKRERERWDAVMSSPHAKGRHRGCVSLLTASQGWTAEQILKNLATLPTDAEIDAKNPANMAKSDAMWDRAWNGDRAAAAVTAATTPAVPSPTAERSDAIWAKAYGAPVAASSAKEEQAPSSKADDVWTRIWGSMGR